MVSVISNFTMSFSVTRSTQTLVAPAEPTPAETLPLSPLDSLPSLRRQLPLLLVFRRGGEAAASIIRDSLAKVLVRYYPLAGRFVGESKSSSTLLVDCNDKGAVLAEASVDCTLEDANYLDHPWVIPRAEFLPVHDGDDDPLLLLQVTKFTCGGVVIGVEISHAMVDGTGLGEFLRAMGELARGLDQPTIKPVWLRDQVMSNPPNFSHTGQISSSVLLHFRYCTVDIPTSYINRVKHEYTEKRAQTCTTFDVTAASIWQGRTRAISFDPAVEVEIMFACNARGVAPGVLPPEGGYYGNYCYPVKVKAPAMFISNASILEVVELVSAAKARWRTRLMKSEAWRGGDFGEVSMEMKVSYGTLFLTDWGRLGFSETDFGWGTPVCAYDVTDCSGMPFCVLGMPSRSDHSKQAQTACVKEEHLTAFLREMSFCRVE